MPRLDILPLDEDSDDVVSERASSLPKETTPSPLRKATHQSSHHSTPNDVVSSSKTTNITPQNTKHDTVPVSKPFKTTPRKTRQSVNGRSDANYDMKLHPSDKQLRPHIWARRNSLPPPTWSETRSRREASLVSSSSSGTHSIRESGSTLTDLSEDEGAVVLERRPDPNATRRSKRKAAKTFVDYSSKHHPQDRQLLGRTHTSDQAVNVSVQSGEPPRKKRRTSFTFDNIDVATETPTQSNQSLKAAASAMGDEPIRIDSSPPEEIQDSEEEEEEEDESESVNAKVDKSHRDSSRHESPDESDDDDRNRLIDDLVNNVDIPDHQVHDIGHRQCQSMRDEADMLQDTINLHTSAHNPTLQPELPTGPVLVNNTAPQVVHQAMRPGVGDPSLAPALDITSITSNPFLSAILDNAGSNMIPQGILTAVQTTATQQGLSTQAAMQQLFNLPQPSIPQATSVPLQPTFIQSQQPQPYPQLPRSTSFRPHFTGHPYTQRTGTALGQSGDSNPLNNFLRPATNPAAQQQDQHLDKHPSIMRARAEVEGENEDEEDQHEDQAAEE